MYSKLSTFSVLLLTALNTTNLYAGTVGNVEKEPAPPGYSLSVTPFYGAINDEGIRKLYMAKTIGSGNNTTQGSRYLVKDFGTSKSPKSTRQRAKYFGRDCPASGTLR